MVILIWLRFSVSVTWPWRRVNPPSIQYHGSCKLKRAWWTHHQIWKRAWGRYSRSYDAWPWRCAFWGTTRDNILYILGHYSRRYDARCHGARWPREHSRSHWSHWSHWNPLSPVIPRSPGGHGDPGSPWNHWNLWSHWSP